MDQYANLEALLPRSTPWTPDELQRGEQNATLLLGLSQSASSPEQSE